VDCAPAAGPTGPIAAACHCPTMCVRILFRFEPVAAPVMVPPGATVAPPSTLDAMVGAGPNRRSQHAGRPPVVVEGHGSFYGGGINRRRSGRGDRVAAVARNQVEHALKCPFHQRLARVAGWARFAVSTPHKCRSGPCGWRRPQIYWRASDGWGVYSTCFFPNSQTGAYFAGWAIWGVCYSCSNDIIRRHRHYYPYHPPPARLRRSLAQEEKALHGR
jgi:hypothetical protein